MKRRVTRRETLQWLGVVGMGAVASACGGGGSGASPTATPSTQPSATNPPTSTIGRTPTMTPAVTASATSTGARTQTAAPTGAPTDTPASPSAAPTNSPSPTASPAGSPTQTPTVGSLSCVVTPAETEGPYFVDERLERSGLTSDTTNAGVLEALPLRLQVGVFAVDGDTCTPVEGAQVDVWHADALGVYSDVQAQNTVGETYLRGYQISDGNGAVTFDTIYPGWYPGRTPHIHFKVRVISAAGATSFEFTSQFFFDDAITDAVFAGAPYDSRGERDTRNADDMIYNTGGTATSPAGDRLLLALQLAGDGSGYVGTFTIGLQMS